MTEVNGETYVVRNPTATDFELYDVYGNKIDSTGFSAYTGGGLVARIYTVTSPYAEQDLAYLRSEEHTSELQSLMRISYAVFCLKKKTNNHEETTEQPQH